MVPDPKLLRAAVRARQRADRAAEVAERLEAAAGVDRVGLRVAMGKISNAAPGVHRAILHAGLTVAQAAEACGTTAGVLKKAWASGSQFRRARPDWRRALAAYGVKRSLWRDEP